MIKKFIADFHIHSKYSHATSKYMDLQALSLWGQYKGIGVMGTGDFTHPIWQQELKQQLCEAEAGLFRLKPEFEKNVQKKLYDSCKHWQRFLLSSEISTIFKRNGRCYRTHSIILAPNFDVVEKITQNLSKIGNLVHDGRPILGMDVKDLLKMILDIHPQTMLIPAHIWTPWFGLLGSKSGFNSVHEAFGDMTQHIYAVEKGLSSNFLMNACLSELDRISILCNSDAHSVQNLGREANCMTAELSYDGIVYALRNPDAGQLVAGIEFFPERGKYYADGHRACNAMLLPIQTRVQHGLCAVCCKPVTVGVLNRVEQLADRTLAQAEKKIRKRFRVVPLFDILQHELQVPMTSKKLNEVYHNILKEVGNEFYVLLSASQDIIAQASNANIAQSIVRVRTGDVLIQPGYDGVYGTVQFK
ncbi:hypothetical protein KAZ82_01480 [Candidatus Babeliales bacterium]|nr:hypothetical protein [Candidatus Babeliales bacterium]